MMKNILTTLNSVCDLHNIPFLDPLLKTESQVTVQEFLLFHAKKHGSRTAIIFEGRKVSYRQLALRAIAFAEHLRSAGLRRDDKVAIVSENSVSLYEAYFGTLLAGCVVVPINVFLLQSEICRVLEDSGAKAVFLSEKFIDIEKCVGKGVKVIVEEDLAKLEPSATLSTFKAVSIPPNRPSFMMYTSGTSGTPKSVLLSSSNAMCNVVQIMAKIDIGSEDKVLAILPLFHSFAQCTCIWAPIVCGTAIILERKIDRSSLRDGFSKGPTLFVGVPQLFGLICLIGNLPLSSVRCFVSGGDALPKKIAETFQLIYGRRIGCGYGLTETSPVVAVNLEDTLTIPDLVGYPVCGLEIELTGDHGFSHGRRVGELRVRGCNVMLGYRGEGDVPPGVDENGWFSTGDLASLDSEGHLKIEGRLKDIIINKGINIYPQEVEGIIMSYPKVARVAVIGEADVMAGEVPIAVVEFMGDPPEKAEEGLRELCVSRLAPYKVPRRFILVDEMPLTSVGKVNKRALADSIKASSKSKK